MRLDLHMKMWNNTISSILHPIIDVTFCAWKNADQLNHSLSITHHMGMDRDGNQ